MRRSTLVMGLFALGIALWLSSRVVDTQPMFALVTLPVGLVFGAFAARVR